MSVLKVGETKRVFHEAGVNRLSHVCVDVLDQAVRRLLEDIANDVVKVYPGRLIESADLVRLDKVKGGYTLRLPKQVDEELNLDALLRTDKVPDDFVPEDEEG